MGSRVNGVGCRRCGSEEVYMDVKQEPSVYKIGAQCLDCSHDYGVVKRIQQEDIRHVDEVYDLGEDTIQTLLER